MGLFSRLGREGVIVPGFGQFVWVAVDFVVVVFPLHFWQSGEVAGSLFCFFLTVCELFIQAGFSGSEVFFGFCCLLVGFVISWGTLCCCSAFVTLKFSLLFVTSKWLLWLGASVAVS